jgi:hypothetical protein
MMLSSIVEDTPFSAGKRGSLRRPPFKLIDFPAQKKPLFLDIVNTFR